MLRRRSIRLRIVVLVLVPMVALLGLYAELLNLTLGHLLTLRQEASIRQLVSLPVTNVQNQLAKERTLALQYLASPSVGNLGLLAAQESNTNSSIDRFRTAVKAALGSGPVPRERNAFLSWQAHLSKMGSVRTSVQSRGLTRIAAVDAYSTVLNEGDNVLNQAITPVLTGSLGVQATDVLTMAKAAQNMGEESDLLRADLIAHSFPSADVMLINQLIVLHQEEWSQTLPNLNPLLQSYFRMTIPPMAASRLLGIEADIASGPSGPSKVPLPTWTTAENAYQAGYLKALLKCSAALSKQAAKQARGLVVRLALIAGIGLIAILIAVIAGITIGRGLVRQLTDLRQSAVKLSTEQLPEAIGRLRGGEDVDVEAEVPRLDPGKDEIGQVKQAFNMAARTAIAAAADEVKIRRGVNDTFRSLARRNQSLLTRQLQLLDSMERRVHDPEELADLFRVDHMTTRMRRHAEGLLIVAGGSSGRTWREPVPIVDVMRAAAAEVEDYPRIRVTSRTGAALAGHAVADIIHLLAELVENAATFSPANTPVRVDGEKVARGVAVEIEDRGLGMTDEQLIEINATLADPPLFDLSGSDQLGLFIAGQLAIRHDVKLTLRGSAYGGITAVVLIPDALVVDTGEPEEPLPIAGIRELGGRPVPELPSAVSDPGRGDTYAVPSAGYLSGIDALSPATADQEAHQAPDAVGEPEPWPVSAYLGDDSTVSELPRRQPGTTGLSWRDSASRAWTAPLLRDESTADVVDAPADVGRNGAQPAGGDIIGVQPAIRTPGGAESTEKADNAELDGLPVRVRQANLAPQLRTQPVAGSVDDGEPPAGPSPEAARSTMAALQLGWQRGRSVAEPATDEASAGPRPQPPGDPADEGGSP
jgi:methyl-accepting chemotaxis protein